MQELGWLTGDKKRWPKQEATVLTMLAAASAPTPGSDPGVGRLMLSAPLGRQFSWALVALQLGAPPSQCMT